jgi:hypothetical protein
VIPPRGTHAVTPRALAALAAMLLACGGHASGDPASGGTDPTSPGNAGRAPGNAPQSGLGQGSSAIIGGVVAPNPLLDHTGTLTYRVRDTGATGALCSASLIGPSTLVTAKHCISVMPSFERAGIDVYWTPGPNFFTPLDAIRVVAVAGAPGDEPGFAGYGRDVGVAHLERESVGVPMLAIRAFSPDLLGRSMVTLGYGLSSAGGLFDGLRRVGRETVSQVEGRAYEGLFGDFESFVELVVRSEATELDIIPVVEADPSLADLAALRLEYDSRLLLPDHEVVTGKAPGDTQSCELDSGGPLALVAEDGSWESYGVVSAGPRLPRPICLMGQVFAVFGPITLPFLEAERAWEDPCGDVTTSGRCDGARLSRCESSFISGVRRLVETDCAAAGETCSTTTLAGAACSGGDAGVNGSLAPSGAAATADAAAPGAAAPDAVPPISGAAATADAAAPDAPPGNLAPDAG